MNPILLSAAFGLLKGFLGPRRTPGTSFREHFMGAAVLGPAHEELMYRAYPLAMWKGMPHGVTAASFALDHVMSERKHFGLAGSAAVARFADVFVGGMLYETAYRRSGFLAAFAAHALHNICCDLGSRGRAK